MLPWKNYRVFLGEGQFVVVISTDPSFLADEEDDIMVPPWIKHWSSMGLEWAGKHHISILPQKTFSIMMENLCNLMHLERDSLVRPFFLGTVSDRPAPPFLPPQCLIYYKHNHIMVEISTEQ